MKFIITSMTRIIMTLICFDDSGDDDGVAEILPLLQCW